MKNSQKLFFSLGILLFILGNGINLYTIGTNPADATSWIAIGIAIMASGTGFWLASQAGNKKKNCSGKTLKSGNDDETALITSGF